MTTSSLSRKQRKTLYNLPWHQRRKKVSVHLETKLMEKYNVRSLQVRKGDTIKILRGDADVLGHEAKVALVDINRMKVIVEGITTSKADGKQKQRFIDPSNLLLIKLDLSDPKRRRRIEKKGKLAEGAVKEEEEKKEEKKEAAEKKDAEDKEKAEEGEGTDKEGERKDPETGGKKGDDKESGEENKDEEELEDEPDDEKESEKSDRKKGSDDE